MEILSNKLCSFLPSINQKQYYAPDTLPIGRIRYTENPITTLKAIQTQFSDFNTLIHLVVQTCHPDLTEPINVQYRDMKQSIKHVFEFIQIDLNKDAVSSNNICNVQPSPIKFPRVLPHLPYCKKIITFLKKFTFQYPDLIDSDHLQV